jgi:hypothetical protein
VRYFYNINVLILIHIFTFDMYHSMQHDLCSFCIFNFAPDIYYRELFLIIEVKCAFFSFNEISKLLQAITLLTYISLYFS